MVLEGLKTEVLQHEGLSLCVLLQPPDTEVSINTIRPGEGRPQESFSPDTSGPASRPWGLLCPASDRSYHLGEELNPWKVDKKNINNLDSRENRFRVTDG